MTFQAAAESLAGAAGDLAGDAAVTVARAWAARILPGAVAGIIGGAMALGAASDELYQVADPLPSDQDMLAAAGDLAGSAFELLRAAAALEAEAQAALSAAACALREATRREARGQAPQARDDAAAAALRIADCECALGILADLIPRLQFALRRLEQVPDDLATAYEVPYQHIRSGRTLPHDGDFLAAEPTEGAA